MNGRNPGMLYWMGAVKLSTHISKLDLNQTFFISIIFYKLKAVEIVTGRMSASTGGKKKRKRKNRKPRRETDHLWEGGGGEG